MKTAAYLKNTRVSQWWYWIGVCIVASFAFSPEVFMGSVLLVVLGFSFLFASAYALNNTYDRESDKGNHSKLNPVARGSISFKESLTESIILGVAGLILLSLVSIEGLIGGVLLLVLSIVYHIPPLRTKARPYLDIITITLLYSTPFFIGYTAINPIDLKGTSFAILFGLLCGSTHPFQTAKDIEEDRRNGDITISVLIGVKKSMLLSLVLLLSTMMYFELLILAKLIDPKMFFIPLLFIPSLLYYYRVITHPSNKKIDNTWNLLRVSGTVGAILPLYLLLA
jgi:1,4-dihydroxy-2-naphthoate octaprenyltransferase